ncbi:response regulator [uncultured Dysosmobacter sp.]|uniref:response regulator n=1 Tax=uncultured Dysosmobacter sp. TaxID=2591384 RepID=UPI0026381D92|nr:response regulator [uncultured Dysosmobacter sp.]
MQNKIKHFLIGSLAAVCVVCIAVFAALAIYLNRQNEQTITQLGNIYMSSMNNRISMHFGSITDHRLSQMRALTEDIPPAYRGGKDALREWLAYNGEARGYASMAYCYKDGSMEMIYGSQLENSSPEAFLRVMESGEDRIAVGLNGTGERVSLICVPASIQVPGLEDCIALVGELPISYIAETLSLEEEDSLIYSFVIRKDGDFVVRNSDAVRDNYFERVQAVYDEVDGRTNEEYIKELKAAMAAGNDYSTMIQFEGERRHMYASPLPNSVWYLITLMPYGALNESVETLGSRSLLAALGGCTVILLVLLAVFLEYFRMNREQMAELEEARRTAEQASRSKSEFLSNMSHDIRTPMNAIVGMTAIATAHVDDSQQVGRCLRKIALSSKHLLGLINDVLDMSKIESGKMTLNVELVSLREVMDSIVSIVQPQIKAKRQNFNISIYNIMSENVHCDSVRLNQILLNLLSNAIKFTPEGGAIEVALHEETSPKGEDHVRIRIHVKDTGIGMSEEFREHIFESFTREDSKRVHKIEGTGLGMAITKYIVDAMGGEITVASQQGKGTEFQVVLDLERAEEREEDMILPDWTMLVVDDDQQLCESTTASLRSIGIRAEWTLDGESAVKMVTQHHKIHNDYHVILLDWKLPEMDGIETARELRRQLGDDVPILLISAYDWSEIEEEARAAGISGFLMKPLFRSTLYYGLKPYAGEIEPQEIKKKAAEPEFSNKRLLVAEDNELNWEISRELLGSMGLELEWAENGQICLDMFQQSPSGYYDAILMDIRMPVMNGYEAADAIRALDRPDAGLPIVAMTADAYSEDIQRCLEHGMNAHVAKPIDIKEVVRVLKRYLDD